ncbi:MAG: sugar lactone lactonase YvrE [Cognaticolwellia sp.]|jgi:sugar lactone lactonase YvrE
MVSHNFVVLINQNDTVMKLFKRIITGLTFLILLFASIILINGCAIHPEVWQPPVKPKFKGPLHLNEKLADISSIDLGDWNGPEEFAFDTSGYIYCGVHKGAKDFSQGAILKISPEGKVEEFLKTDSWVTGIQFDNHGNLIALMNGVGLIRIDQEKRIEILVEKDADGRAILMGSGLTIAKDGKIYFANLSSETTSSAKYINKLFLELKPTGGVYCYDPQTKVTQTISNGNYFANGLELSKNESFLLLSETSRYRILKYWLKGEKAGTFEVFLENLAGFPNNISRRDNGNFWVGFTTKRNDQLDDIHPKAGMKKFVYGLPSFFQPKAEKFGMILEISEEGKIIQALFDTSGESVMEAGAVKEFRDNLYIGGDIVSYIAKYKLI